MRIALAILVLAAPAGAAQARDTAPLPAACQDETSRGEYEVHDTVPALKGTYAHGIAGGAVLEEIDTAGAFCEGSAEERKGIAERYASVHRKEYWFYGTAQQGVLFTKETSFPGGEQAPKCRHAILVTHQIQRAYVADGFIHNFVFEDNMAPEIGSFRKGRSAGEYSGSFMELQSLMARAPLPERRTGRRLKRERVAGQPALCSIAGGIVWSVTCLAERGPIRGMLLRSSAGDDERTMFGSVVLEVLPDVRLPGVLFEVDREWRLRDDPAAS
jgi:hypothetical protein